VLDANAGATDLAVSLPDGERDGARPEFPATRARATKPE
jgi:hypothetical protein